MVESKLQQYTIEEVAGHNNDKSTWIILNNKVYDVTKFLLEHPGGEDTILEHAGTDATISFNDVGHSSDARQLAEDYLIGVVHGNDTQTKKADKQNEKCGGCSWSDVIFSPTWTNFIIPVVISACVLVTYKIAQKVVYNIQ